jgi:hypothetical protein
VILFISKVSYGLGRMLEIVKLFGACLSLCSWKCQEDLALHNSLDYFFLMVRTIAKSLLEDNFYDWKELVNNVFILIFNVIVPRVNAMDKSSDHPILSGTPRPKVLWVYFSLIIFYKYDDAQSFL